MTKNPLIERIARAIYEAPGLHTAVGFQPTPWEMVDEKCKADWIVCAKAAIEAIHNEPATELSHSSLSPIPQEFIETYIKNLIDAPWPTKLYSIKARERAKHIEELLETWKLKLEQDEKTQTKIQETPQ